MVNKQESYFAKVVVVALGCLLLGMGLITFFYPQIMSRYGLVTDTLHARLTISALIGGSEIGLGLFMILVRKVQATISVRLWVGLSIFSGIVAARLVSLIITNGPIPNMIYGELIAESVIILLLITALQSQPATKQSPQRAANMISARPPKRRLKWSS